MNTASLKTFAPEVRRQLMEAVGRKLDFVLTGDTADLRAMPEQRKSLKRQVERDRKGLIERVAYTWFNRLAALRFMDARSWHPFRARVLTPASDAETQPEILKLTRTGALPEELRPHADPTRLNDLLDGRIPSPDAQGEVYRHLVLAACRFYNALLPDLFEKLDDETELLLPDDLLTEHSVVHGFRTEISDEDCGDGQRANVEILGWLYQFYISDRKDQVMARKSAVPTEDIPAVTQLFTPHWIVRYLVENSLGRLWLLNRPGSKLREHMPYYIEDSEQGSVASGQKEVYANHRRAAGGNIENADEPTVKIGHSAAGQGAPDSYLKKGFNALIYLHRYTKDTANSLLNRYLRDYLQKIHSRLEHLDQVQVTAESTREKTAARKERDALNKTLRECEAYERDILLPLAQQRIELDLDDGVKVNYLKLGESLAPIAGLAAKEEE